MDAMHAMDIVLRAYPGGVILGMAESNAGFIFSLGTPEENTCLRFPEDCPWQ